MMRNQKNSPSSLKIKALVILFYDIRGLVHNEFIPEEQTVDKEAVLKRLGENIRRKWSELWMNN